MKEIDTPHTRLNTQNNAKNHENHGSGTNVGDMGELIQDMKVLNHVVKFHENQIKKCRYMYTRLNIQTGAKIHENH